MKKIVLDMNKINWCHLNLFEEMRWMKMSNIPAEDIRNRCYYIMGIAAALEMTNVITTSTKFRVDKWLFQRIQKLGNQ